MREPIVCDLTHTRDEWIHIMHNLPSAESALFTYINGKIGDFDESERHEPLTITFKATPVTT